MYFYLWILNLFDIPISILATLICYPNPIFYKGVKVNQNMFFSFPPTSNAQKYIYPLKKESIE
jgi:hypothetical protein